MEGHTEEYCWRKHPEKRPASLAQMSVDNTSSKIVEELRGILHENENDELSSRSRFSPFKNEVHDETREEESKRFF